MVSYKIGATMVSYKFPNAQLKMSELFFSVKQLVF